MKEFILNASIINIVMSNSENVLQRFVCDPAIMDKINKMLECKQCKIISIKNVYFANSCHNGVFCLKCSESMPCCKGKETQYPELASLLRQVKVRCINYSKGCLELIPFDRLLRHEEDCQLRSKNPSSPSMAKDESLKKKFDISDLPGIVKPQDSSQNNSHIFSFSPFPTRDNEESKSKMQLLEARVKDLEDIVKGESGIQKHLDDCKIVI